MDKARFFGFTQQILKKKFEQELLGSCCIAHSILVIILRFSL